MNYPLISEYIESIRFAEDNFDELNYLRPVLDDEGLPVMSSGNFAVVFKMKDERNGNLYAVKCFTKEQEGRAESYKLIADELEFVSSRYLTPIKYFEKELFVDTKNSDENEFPVLLMDWVEGKTLDKYLHDHSGNKFILELLAFQFCKMASWLLSQPFAHGDLKPDNILIKKNASIVLVDYDGMFVPAMKGENAREQGSPGFRHLMRLNGDFDEHIDDFPIALIAMALKAYSISPELLNKYCNNESFFFREEDFTRIHSTKAMKDILELIENEELCSLLGAFMIALTKGNLDLVSPRLYLLKNPKMNANYGEYIYNFARNLCEGGKDKNKTDYSKAFRLFQKAAKLGNADAQCCVGCCFKNGYGTSVDYTKARVWYEKSSKNGCARALRHIAMCYEDGLGVDKDIHEAIKWYKKAIDHKDGASMEIMGKIFYYGRGGISIDYVEAYKWYKKAAEAGDSGGMWRLGICYHLGTGVEKNDVEAYKWYKKAAEAGDSGGMRCLGGCYQFGTGVEKNEAEAFKWYKKATEQKDLDSQWLLGYCYEHGIGTTINLSLAKSFLKLAAKQGHKKAQEELERLENDIINKRIK